MTVKEKSGEIVKVETWSTPLLLGRDFGNWLAGFIDGEGCFFVRKSNRSRGYIEWQVSFTIRLRRDDEEILIECKERTGLGVIKRYPARVNRQGIRSNPSSVWEIRKFSECVRLGEILTEHPMRAKKARDLWRWSRILQKLMLTKGNKHHGRRDNRPIQNMVDELRERRKYHD